MTNKIRKVLDRIDSVLAEGDADSARLWDVLTALRGPDHYSNSERKMTGTTHVRAAAFPQTAASDSWYYASMKPTTDIVTEVQDSNLDYTHFESHLQRAFTVLGLSS